METFKKPLTAAQEKACLTAMREGSGEARMLLIEHNMRLVAHIIKKYAFTDKENDDLLSIGTIGLIKAVNTFDEKRGNRLSSYAAKCIDNEVLMLLRTEKKNSKEVSLYEPIGTDKEGNEIHLLDVIESRKSDVVEEYCKKESIIQLYEGLESCLNDRERAVIRLRYGLWGERMHTQKEAGRILGISRSYISRIEKSSLEKLKFYLRGS